MTDAPPFLDALLTMRYATSDPARAAELDCNDAIAKLQLHLARAAEQQAPAATVLPLRAGCRG
ncbi:hypothetical protein ACFSCW_12080 [Sphingomonas tabacisoli]|uniref:Uncharacterized protein n=1 Tax=Sphingomonas tabacisoli TaxID=2249466 RepID=A0ABW4I3N2_9SPHN